MLEMSLKLFRQHDRLPIQNSIIVGKLADLKGLVRGNVSKDLDIPAARPLNLQACEPGGMSQANRLLQRAGAETASTRDVPVDRQRVVPRGHNLDSGADGRTIRLLADKFQRQPVMLLAGVVRFGAIPTRVLEQNVVVSVAGRGAPHLDEDVGVAVTVPVAAGDAMALLQVARTG